MRYEHLKGGNTRAKHATHVGTTDPELMIDATIHLERRVGHRPMPTFEDYVGCQPRQRLSTDEFAVHYGADPAVVEALITHCEGNGLTVEDVHLARRHIRVSGKIKHFNAAMGIDVQTYAKHDDYHGHYHFRSHDAISLPETIAPHVVGVFGIDDEHRQKPIQSSLHGIPPVPTISPPNTRSLTPQQIKVAYNTTTNDATGQVIGLYGWNQSASDISKSLSGWGLNPNPNTTLIYVNGASMDDISTRQEGVLDNAAAAAMAPGARLVVYFPNLAMGSNWIDLVARMIHPSPGDQPLNIISISIIFTGDVERNFPAFVRATESLFEDAAAQSITVFSATGDDGSSNYATDGSVNAGFPCVSPWVTNCGGTVIGDIQGDGTIFTEWAWNGSGGGVSIMIPQPSYQQGTGMPLNMVTGFAGRAYPDICAPASPYSGMDIYVNDQLMPHGADGTSCSAPLCAGMFATMNAALGFNAGFLNPTLYFVRNYLFRCQAVNAPGFFSDSHGNQWALTAGAQISFNGVTDPNTSNVAYLLYSILYDQMWHENASGNWYSKAATSTAPGNWNAVAQSPISRLVCIRDIDGSGGDQDNAYGTSPGYPVHAGFDCVTGFGAVNMAALWDYIRTYSTYPLKRVWVRVQAHTAIIDSPISDIVGPTVLD